MVYTVKQLAEMAGVSRRTLHYYDEIGLLQPWQKGENGYRYYDDAAVLRLQQILFYRELGLSLQEIETAVSAPDFDVLQALQAHRLALLQRTKRLENLIQTIDKTIDHLEGKFEMSTQELFTGFDEETQKAYEIEAAERWDADEVKATSQRWQNYSAGQKKQIMAEGEAVYLDLLAAMDKGAESPEVQQIMVRWHQHMRHFYEPSVERLRGLGWGYANDPAFAAFYEKIHPDMPQFISQAIAFYCDHLDE
ncbi:MAG: MerR family transcriptional regulator [Chloroflexota bacterium]|jgi:MerR family transcriptional regulator, thiopeptide resistance regulator